MRGVLPPRSPKEPEMKMQNSSPEPERESPDLRPYEKPAITSEGLFETKAGCDKYDIGVDCPTGDKDS